MVRKRIDLVLVEMGLASTRTKAQDLIQRGLVSVQVHGVQKKILKANQEYLGGAISIEASEASHYVSRAALKLVDALVHTKISVKDLRALDVGQSTGGFSQCLLDRGVVQVVGVDVGSGQLDPIIRKNAQVICFENTNARYLSQNADFVATVPKSGFDLAVIDVSFISLTMVLPEISRFAKQILALVKPQFEVGADGLNKRGVVKDPQLYQMVQKKITDLLAQLGWVVVDYFSSSLLGKEGNQEFFVYARRP